MFNEIYNHGRIPGYDYRRVVEASSNYQEQRSNKKLFKKPKKKFSDILEDKTNAETHGKELDAHIDFTY